MTDMDGIDPAIAEAIRRATAFSVASSRSLDPSSHVLTSDPISYNEFEPSFPDLHATRGSS